MADPFAGCVIGGRGGSGKTRLAVELCQRVRARDWLCGLLSRITEPETLEALVNVPTARLVVVDYAESRAEHLELLLPLLAAGATQEQPVRVLLLVRAGARRTADWTEGLRNRSDRLDALLDECEVRVLEDMPLETAERYKLFSAAAGAFADRADPPLVPPDPPDVLDQAVFNSPLLVVIAAYLAVHGDAAVPSTRAALLGEVLAHEQRYWRASAGDLFSDEVLPRRVVGLATLAGAESEAAATELLRLVPDLADATAERRASLARWAHGLYPGPKWWNPLEPDLVGERLVADTFTDQPSVLAGALAREDPQAIIQPLEVYARAAADHAELAATLRPILSREVGRLCEVAVTQAATGTDRDLLSGNTATAAAAINRAITTIEVDASALSVALVSLPQRADLILSPLAVTLNTQHVKHQRALAAANPTAYEPSLATWLNNLSVRLAEVGRREEGLAAIEEAVDVYRRLAAANPAAYEPGLASSLNNLAVDLGEVGRREEGLTAIEEAVDVYRRLVAVNPAAHEPDLASSLNNLAARLGGVGRREEGLAAIEEAVDVYRRLAAVNPAAYELDLAISLNTLSIRLGEMGRREEGLAAIEEAVEVRRRLAAVNPAAYEPGLAISLNNLSIRLGEMGRREEGLAAIEEAVDVYRRLAAVSPDAYEPHLALSLNNLSARLGGVGRGEEGLAASEEAVDVYRRLVAVNPAAHEPDLAISLNNLSIRLGTMGRGEEGLAASEEAVEVRRRLAAVNPAAYEPGLASSLNNLSVRLAEVGRREEALAATEEAVDVYRRLAAMNRAAYEPDLVISLNNLSISLGEVGRREEALAATEEAVDVYRRLAAMNRAAYEPGLASSLNNLAGRLTDAGRFADAARVRQQLADLSALSRGRRESTGSR
jgi:tetratricopeptide (TPR) repeat protein